MFLNTDGGGGGGGGSDVGWSQWVECGLDLGLCLHSLCKQWYTIIFSLYIPSLPAEHGMQFAEFEHGVLADGSMIIFIA